MFEWSQISAWADLSTWVACITTAALAAGLVLLHSPHDAIAGIGLAGRGGGRKKTVFTISRHNLFRSTQGGPWKRLTTGLGVWKLSSIAISPDYDTDGTLFVASFGGGVFRSTDGGLSWMAINKGMGDQQILLLGLSPEFSNDRVMFALSRNGAIYRSSDAGENWTTVSAPVRPVEDDPAIGTLLDPLRDAGEAWRACYWNAGPGCMAFASDGMVVGASDGEVRASRDGGETWSTLAMLPGGERITCIEAPRAGSIDGVLYVGTDGAGVWRISDGGAALAQTAAPKALAVVSALGSYRDASGRLVVAACGWSEALFVSSDDGDTWTAQSAGLTKHRQADEPRYGAPHFSALAIDADGPGPELYLGGFDGLFHADEPGKAWGSIETLPLGNVLSLSVSPTSGDEAPALAVATYGAGVYFKPADGGDWKILNQGLTTLRLGTIAFSPDWARDRTLFTVNEGNLLISIDGGAWTPISLRPADRSARFSVRLFARLRMLERFAARHLSGRWMNFLKAFAHAGALRASGRVNQYVFPTVLTFSRSYKEDRTLFVGTRSHGVFRSTDGGASFTQLWNGGGLFVTSMDVSTGPADGRTLFACVADGLYRSDDSAETWRLVTAEPAFQGSRLAMSPDFRSDGILFVGGREGLLRSSDGGATWERLTLDDRFEAATIGGLGVSPDFAHDRCLLAHFRGRGLYRSTDGGDSFELLPGDFPAYDHGFTPLHCFPDANTLFDFSPAFGRDGIVAAADMDVVHLTRDRGLSWTALPKPTRYESARAEVTYAGGWTIADNPAFSAGRAHHSRHAGDTASLRFAGEAIRWMGSRGPDLGMAEVFVDGSLRATVDLYAPTRLHAAELFAAPLELGHHEIKIRVLGTKNSKSAGVEVWLDALDAA